MLYEVITDGTDLMAELLRSEGVEVVNSQIINFRKYFWDPATGISEQNSVIKNM